jgi:hypothetical protein
MSADLISTIGKYVIALAVIAGSFVIIYQDANNAQPWTVVGLIVGWIIRDSAGQSATSNAVRLQQTPTNGAPHQ